MIDELDDLFAAAALSPPPDFAARLVALARQTPQPRPAPVSPWAWLSLGAGAGVGACLLAEFAVFAFVANAAS